VMHLFSTLIVSLNQSMMFYFTPHCTQFTHQSTPMYRNVHGSTPMYTNLHGSTQMYTNLHTFTWIVFFHFCFFGFFLIFVFDFFLIFHFLIFFILIFVCFIYQYINFKSLIEVVDNVDIIYAAVEVIDIVVETVIVVFRMSVVIHQIRIKFARKWKFLNIDYWILVGNQ
jgi:hypothetical protein